MNKQYAVSTVDYGAHPRGGIIVNLKITNLDKNTTSGIYMHVMMPFDLTLLEETAVKYYTILPSQWKPPDGLVNIGMQTQSTCQQKQEMVSPPQIVSPKESLGASWSFIRWLDEK